MRASRSAQIRGLILLGLLVVVSSPAVRPVLSAGTTHHARLNGPPAQGSGALPAYPLNHTLDTTVTAVGTPPTNSGFEAAGQSVGTPPSNDDFASAPTTAGTPPQNSDFETGDLSGWTTTGTVTVGSDHTHYAKLGSAGGTLTSSAFTVDASTQALSVDVGYLTTNSYSGSRSTPSPAQPTAPARRWATSTAIAAAAGPRSHWIPPRTWASRSSSSSASTSATSASTTCAARCSSPPGPPPARPAARPRAAATPTPASIPTA